MAHEVTSANPGELQGISAKTNDIHHGKLYAGYVAKRNEIEEKLRSADVSTANQVYSEWRGLKEGETFAANGMILHEIFFDVITEGNGDPAGTTIESAIVEQWGSWERFMAEFTATGMASRGWAILAYDPSDNKLHIYGADFQSHGGVWGSTPVLPCDVYEHAYVLDFGADRKAYIEAFFKNVNWERVEKRYLAVKK